MAHDRRGTAEIRTGRLTPPGLRVGLVVSGAAPDSGVVRDLVRTLEAAPVCEAIAYQHATHHSLAHEVRHADALVAYGLGAGELEELDELVTPGLPVIVLAPAAGVRLPRGRSGALLGSPWDQQELDAALRLAARGGVYHDPVAATDRARAHAADDPATQTEPGNDQAPELTPREQDVLLKLAEGWTNRGIAMELGISENTVKFHLSAVFRKLGAEGRTEAVIAGVQRGLVSL